VSATVESGATFGQEKDSIGGGGVQLLTQRVRDSRWLRRRAAGADVAHGIYNTVVEAMEVHNEDPQRGGVKRRRQPCSGSGARLKRKCAVCEVERNGL
jgi:hypothetical protein